MAIPLTLGPAIICVLIAAVVIFGLVAPTGLLARTMNTFGGAIQWCFVKMKGLFGKK